MGDKTKVTIYDLAQKLGTTASTVSRALQDNPRISLKTREAVKKLARELNYIPDPIAHHLRTGRGNVLGIIVPRIDRNFFASIISSFQNVAQQAGFQIIIAASNERADDEYSALKSLIQKKVDGIAISLSVNTQNAADYASLSQMHNIPLVFFDRLPIDWQDYDTISNDNYQIGYDAVVQLHRRGCQKIGHFAGPQNQRSYIDRYRGYRQALDDLHLSFRQEWVFPGITIETGYDAAQKILTMEERPDGIFSAGDFPAITAMDTFRKKGLEIPKDIAIIGVANEPLDAYLATPLASVELNQQRIGEQTARILISRIKDDDNQLETPAHMIIKHDLILRDSLI